jgi:hypothetical protein
LFSPLENAIDAIYLSETFYKIGAPDSMAMNSSPGRWV